MAAEADTRPSIKARHAEVMTRRTGIAGNGRGRLCGSECDRKKREQKDRTSWAMVPLIAMTASTLHEKSSL